MDDQVENDKDERQPIVRKYKYVADFQGIYEMVTNTKKDPWLYDDVRLEKLNFSVRLLNYLRRMGINTIGDLLDVLEHNEFEYRGANLPQLRGFAEGILEEMIEKMKAQGYLR